MRRTSDITYFRDLACRQNHDITQAQIHVYFNAKRYYKNDILESIEYFKNVEECRESMKEVKQVKLEGKDIEKQNKTSENSQEQYEKELESKIVERLFVYQRKLILVDSDKNILRLKYKSDLFDDLMLEFRKLYEWLDYRASYLKFTDNDGNEHIIDKSEIKTVIHFLDKLNKIKRDDK